jgi:hypothetical protein
MDKEKSEINEPNENLPPESPFAKYTGVLTLGNREIDCYVLDTKERVISMRTTVKAIANTDSGNLANYVGIKAIQPYLNSNDLLGNIIEFSIPGNPIKSKGITAETFLDDGLSSQVRQFV